MRVNCLTQSARLIVPLACTVLHAAVLITQLPAEPAATDRAGQLAEESSKEPGPSWDPRPAWQRTTDGAWRSIFRRRPVENEMPSEIAPVVGSRPFRVPRAMTPVPSEVAPAVQPFSATTAGRIKSSACRRELNYLAPKSTPAEDKHFVATLEQVMDVFRRNPAFPPPGFEVAVSCGFEKRSDGTGIYQGRITMLFYPDSDARHHWHGGLEILVNDLGVMGPRNNAQDRASDPDLVFPIPAPATYRGYPWLAAEHGVWGGIYLSKRPEQIYNPVTYRDWLAENLPKLESEYRERKAVAEAKASVRNQFVLRNFQSMYERALITSRQMPAAEQDAPLWLYDQAPSDAANPDAARQVRLNLDGYFDRKLPANAIQIINILPVHARHDHLHAVLGKLDYAALLVLVR